MGLFDKEIKELKAYIQKKNDKGKVRKIVNFHHEDWPQKGASEIILKDDVGVELGNPGNASKCFFVWTENGDVRDGRITIIGPDLTECKCESIPFAQILIFRGRFEDEYERYRELRSAQYNTNLHGYMIRIIPQRQQIWSRISKDALEKGFSLKILGRYLIEKSREMEYVDGAEVIFVTSSKEDVKELNDISTRVQRIFDAMNKMVEEMSLDCDTCEYNDVCYDVQELRKIRERLQKLRSEK